MALYRGLAVFQSDEYLAKSNKKLFITQSNVHGFSTTHLDLRSKGTYLQRRGISFVTMTWITEELFDFRQEQHIYLFPACPERFDFQPSTYSVGAGSSFLGANVFRV